MADELLTPAGIRVPMTDIELTAMRASGAGGQHVNKVSSAIHLRFAIKDSALPEDLRERLMTSRDARVTKEGVLILKAQKHRTQERNRRDALERLAALIDAAAIVPARRVPTRPSRAARVRRVNEKKQRSALKKLRGPVDDT